MASETLQRGIVERQQELHRVAEIIARAGARFTRNANIIKVSTIALGAFTAAKATADAVAGEHKMVTLVMFTIVGMLVSIATGVEAAFKFDARGNALTLLAASCHATVRRIDSDWRRTIGAGSADRGSIDETQTTEAARLLLTTADDQLAIVQDGAAKLGINITYQVYSLHGNEYRDKVAA